MTPESADHLSEQTASQTTLEGILAASTSSYGTMGERTYAVLREAILTGVLVHDTVLRQESLAVQLGISRVPVRDALKQLEADGLVVTTPRRGARVRGLSRALVQQTFEVRSLLETYALRRSMDHMTPERAGRLMELALRMDAPGKGDDFRELMLRFYHELYDAEGQPVLAAMIDRLRDTVGRQLVARRMHSHGVSHRDLVFPVIAGDVDTAVNRLEEHLDDVKTAILKQPSITAEV